MRNVKCSILLCSAILALSGLASSAFAAENACPYAIQKVNGQLQFQQNKDGTWLNSLPNNPLKERDVTPYQGKDFGFTELNYVEVVANSPIKTDSKEVTVTPKEVQCKYEDGANPRPTLAYLPGDATPAYDVKLHQPNLHASGDWWGCGVGSDTHDICQIKFVPN